MEKLPFEQIKRRILIKKEAQTNPEYGKKPEERTIEELIQYGVINLNKSSGPTSHQTADYVKRILKLKKAGHSGTLDPKVTGVLPIALGRATRITQTLLKAGKEYVCLMHIHKPASQSKIHKKAKEFTGKIEQMPPIKSAVKRQLRTREVYYFKILEIDNQEVLFRIGTEAGTYIRKIAHDFGKSLKTNAHMVQLIRTKAGPFKEEDSVTLHDLKDAYEFYKEGNQEPFKKIIKPIEFAIDHLPKIYIMDTTVDSICHGASLSIPGISKLDSEIKENELVAVLTLKNELVAVGKARLSSEQIIKETKGVAVSNMKVFMLPDTYPKYTVQKQENL